MSAQRAAEFDITFKVYPDGRASGYLDRLAVGDTISVFGMGKKHRAPDVTVTSSVGDLGADAAEGAAAGGGGGGGGGGCVGIVAFGVGITEALPIAAAELARPGGEHTRVTVLWQSRSWRDTFWHEEIAALERAHPNRFRFVTMLSREDREGCLRGRVDPARLAEVFDAGWGVDAGDIEARARVKWLSVGTKPMMKAVDLMLAENRFPMPQHALLQRK